MTASAHVTSSNYKNGVAKEEKIKASIRQEAQKKHQEAPSYVPPLMPKLDSNGRPIFDCSSNSAIHKPSPSDVRSGLPMNLGNGSMMTELGEGSWMRRRISN
jgi:hypothetical protein